MPYRPPSEFLRMVADEEVALTGSEFANCNLRRLMGLMRDEDVSNRDWATMLLAMEDIDTPVVWDALLAATNDDDVSVRGEALEGLAERNGHAALPLVLGELQRNECGYGAFQAARIIAHSSLLDPLRAWLRKATASSLDREIGAAIAACEGSKPRV